MPLDDSGSRSECLFAFARQRRRSAVTCVPRLITTAVARCAAPPLGPSVWDDTSIELAATVEPCATCSPVASWCRRAGDSGYALPAATIFERFPVALLVPADLPGVRSTVRHCADAGR